MGLGAENCLGLDLDADLLRDHDPAGLELIERWLVGPVPSDELAAFVATLRTLRDGVRPCAEAGAKTTAVSNPGDRAPAVSEAVSAPA